MSPSSASIDSVEKIVNTYKLKLPQTITAVIDGHTHPASYKLNTICTIIEEALYDPQESDVDEVNQVAASRRALDHTDPASALA